MQLTRLIALVGVAAAGCGTVEGFPLKSRVPVDVAVYAQNNTKVAEMSVGQSVLVRTYLIYAEGDSSLTPNSAFWVSKDSSVAMATDGLGTIKGLKAGSTIITLTTDDRFRDTLQVIVHQ